MGDRNSAYTFLVGKTERKKSLGKPRRRWDVILKRKFKMWDSGMVWINPAQARDRWHSLVNAVMKT
jgi:hypothetical protein